MSALALSVLLSFVSAVAYAGGAIVQEQVALTSPDQTYAPLRRPGWWAAVALSGVGGVLHVVALAYGPLSLVQPLGALTIVFALPMAAVFVGRKAGATAWRGAIMATVGLAVLLALVGSADSQSLSDTQITVLAVVSGGAVAAFMVAGRAAHRHPAVRSVMLAVGSGIAFSMSSVFTKTVAVDWSHQVSLSDLPSLALIGVFATAGMLLSQASYRGGGLAAPLATLTVVNPVVAAAVGITMFGETFRYGETGTVLALACGVVAAGGLILLTTEQIGSARNTAEVAASAAAETEPAPEAATPDSALEALLLAALPEQSTGPDHEDGPTTSRGETFGAGFGDGFDAGLGEAFDAKLGDKFDAGLGEAFDAGLGNELGSGLGAGLGKAFDAGLGSGLGAGLGDGFDVDRGEDVFVPAPAMVGASESAPDPADSPESSEEDAPPALAYFGPLCGPYVVATPLLDHHHRTRVTS
ncbi:DMT family transporter [Streptomyces mirabilis]|uniref:Permease of the drug/metabolite transporter (DMT) superfamily n=1 Tax=Streptomyces mirabilis TaxID=68239 RepID=A0A1I2LMC9_9ACTN|nr:DMT family transporter [Streptomyces mirabilis]SFF79688.1 Permease of the drug/metabolite transporter (DMT) superfamily [Streptomyces mirabilis]